MDEIIGVEVGGGGCEEGAAPSSSPDAPPSRHDSHFNLLYMQILYRSRWEAGGEGY